MKKALFVLDHFETIYSPDVRRAIAADVELYAPQQKSDVLEVNPDLLRDVDVILSGWGAPRMDEIFLEAAPRLEAVFYGAGSIRSVTTEAFWRRGITIVSAWAANGVPVAEYALSQVLFSLKQGYRAAAAMRADPAKPFSREDVVGAYGSTVGIISLGMIGRLVVERLKVFDVHIVAYDPFVAREEAEALGVELVSLDEAFRRSDVVTLHTPWLEETEGLIAGRHFALMKKNAAFINTARGAIVRESEMIEALRQRPDLFAVLDVTRPEPPAKDSPLWVLPNVFLTPHIAGSMGKECYRMGAFMLEELKRYVKGEPLQWRITEEMARRMA